jgi:hypothetical protein
VPRPRPRTVCAGRRTHAWLGYAVPVVSIIIGTALLLLARLSLDRAD